VTFNSLQYAAFLPIVVLTYWQLSRRAQNVFLLGASYLFYGFWDWRFLGLLLLSTSVDYFTGKVLASSREERRRLVLAVSLLTNLGILGFFKYFNFFIDSAERVLEKAGLEVAAPVLQIALPVGISFYTFHGMSYTIDLYRRHIEPATSFVTFAAFVSFFPQLVAGPIGRASFQLPQFERERERPGVDGTLGALGLILLGLFKKVAIADAVAPVASAAFADPDAASWPLLLLGAYAFALQIYGDFAGYTDIARGSARLMGFELPANFEQPYLSRNITEFWRTWHISLSTWLRDYLYVPLGGNRGSRASTYRNLFLVMLIGGLWHGAAWTFVVWGALHGVLLAGHKWWSDRHEGAGERGIMPPPDPSAVPTHEGGVAVAERSALQTRSALLPAWAWTLITFHVVVGLWVFFRAPTVGAAIDYLGNLLTFSGGSWVNWDDVLVVGTALAMTLLLDLGQRRHRDDGVLRALRPSTLGVVIGAMLVAILVFSGGTPVPFIYFQF
jgi:alginate O-acetyltransferase complex protein AlgI